MKAGTRLGPYEIVMMLGAGGMGEVYRARDTRLGRDVAVKILPPDKVNGERLQRFLREARAASQLNHPNVVAIHDIGEHEGIHFIVMEYVDGKTLADAIPAKGWETGTVTEYARQIVSSLAKAHASGIVHRDLKPANIMLTRGGTIKVLDFGLAKLEEPNDVAVTAETEPGMILGTAAYMSPEQASGRPADARSDIFSFGLILYEMLTGQRAFSGENAVSTMAAILSQEPRPLPSQVPSTLERIVSRCLRKQPDKRFQSAADLDLALEDIGAATSAESPSIAVLPFSNLSPDKENEYFSDGLAEEILNALTQLPGLRVIARASAFAFRGREHEIREIGEKLKVQTILQGSVRRAGNRVRVTAQLIKVSDESQLWSERYDGDMTDVFAIQDEVAQAIVDKLKVKLGGKHDEPIVKRYTKNLEAHSLYLKGVFHLNRMTPDEIERGRAYLERVVAVENGYAPAWVQLAQYYLARVFSGSSMPLDFLAKALLAARQAVAADETLAEGHAAVAFLVGMYEYRWAEALAEREVALRLPASSWSEIWSACALWHTGRTEEVLAGLHRALTMDPLSGLAHYLIAILHSGKGRYDLSVTHATHALEINPDFPLAHAALGMAQAGLGDLEKGIASLEKAYTLGQTGWYAGCLGSVYIAAGRKADAIRLLNSMEEKRSVGYASAFGMALISASLGDSERALHLLNAAVDDHEGWLCFLPTISSYLGPLRLHPRFAEIMRRTNLPEFASH